MDAIPRSTMSYFKHPRENVSRTARAVIGLSSVALCAICRGCHEYGERQGVPSAKSSERLCREEQSFSCGVYS